MTNEEIANNYLQWFSTKYEQLKRKYRKFCQEKYYDWDEDIFSDTYLRIYETIKKKGLEYTTNQGFEDYTFRSFKQNLQREKQYCRVARRDNNISNDNINDLYENWYNLNNTSETNKIKQDLFTDWATLYIMGVVEENFDSEHTYLFKMKTMYPDMTYKKLQEKTKIKGVRQKVVDVRNFLKDNLKKDDLNREFYNTFGNLL